MNNNYAVINGKRIELTEDQVKTLGVEVRKNPFERVDRGEDYFYINRYGDVNYYEHDEDFEDDLLSQTANYFNDKDFAQQVALHQLLYRKLLKFAYGNGFEDTVWNNQNDHWYIFYNYDDGCFDSQHNDGFKTQSVYFSSAGAANRAICEVVMPFIKEHPEFIW